jgi:aldehyde dehydrogenase (NAD+)
MRSIDRIYIDGRFVTPHGAGYADLFNPATEECIGRVRLADDEDARAAVTAAKRAFPAFSRTGKADRIALLRRLHDAVAARAGDLAAVMAEEYGAPAYFVDASVKRAATIFLDQAETLEAFSFTEVIGRAEVTLQPIGVVAAITPWNSNYGFICGKIATALAAGCSIVVKPSEMSALQTDLITQALHQADLPPGLVNIVTGLGAVVGAELSRHPDIAKVSFTGSTATGRILLTTAAETFKRVTLELGGKGPSLILADADLDMAVKTAAMMGLANSGQACIAGTRILAPRSRLDDILPRLSAAVAAIKVGPGSDPAAMVGPMVSQKQWDRVQGYIRLGQEEGATILTGGEGRPDGLSRGWFVRPTVFAGVKNDMRIAREEIFGPVLSVIAYEDEEEAIAIANDSPYGLQAYVMSGDPDHARAIAARLECGRVAINGAAHEPRAPFGGFKQSGIGREYGRYGLMTHLEPKAVIF